MHRIEAIHLDKPISSKGLKCNNCNNDIDTRTTTTMLCEKCRRKYVAQKAAETMQKRYGVSNAMYIPGMTAKIQSRMYEKYGGYCAMTSPGPRAKFEQTMEKRYGVKYYVNSEQFVNKSDCKSKINQNFARLLENENIPFTEERVLDDKRFDFSFKDIKTFIEIDPTYTHNSAGNHWDKSGLDSDSQLIKTLVAERHNYRCIHVFDWDDKQAIIQLVSPKIAIYARNCEIKSPNFEELVKFLKHNSFYSTIQLQDTTHNKSNYISLGLYYQNALVQVIVLNKSSKYGYMYEIVDLCTAKQNRVIGGASRLFKHIKEEIQCDSIVAECDRAKFTGRVFKELGMELVGQINPQVVWSKRQLKIENKETMSDEDAVSMLNDGWLPVYDCGKLIFASGNHNNDSNNQLNNSSYSSDELNYAQLLQSIDKNKEKLCEFCGEPFVPRSNFQRYCKRPHYMACPVCNKPYLVTNNENLKRPPVACSYACRAAKTRKTSLEKYGTVAPGNNPEARAKARQTMQEKYGVDYTLQSEELKAKVTDTIVEKYGVDNVQKLDYVAKETQEAKHNNWIEKVHRLLPMKLEVREQSTKFNLKDSDLSIFVLTEKASTTFLRKYGINKYNNKFGKIHLSLGLVNDGILYQVIRFEKKPNSNEIILANFGTRADYFISNNYTRLLNFAVQVKGIEEFDAYIPRNVATEELLKSMSLELIETGEYEVYWKIKGNKLFNIPDKFVELNKNDNIEQMLKTHEYVTTDYIDKYNYHCTNQQITMDSETQFIIQSEHLE